MSDPYSSPRMPSTLSPPNIIQPFNQHQNHDLTTTSPPYYYSNSNVLPRTNVAVNGARHPTSKPLPMPVLNPSTVSSSISSSISPTVSRQSHSPQPGFMNGNNERGLGRSWSASRIIHLQKMAEDTVELCPSITKYCETALDYTNKVCINETSSSFN